VFGFSFGELLVICVVALIAVGPKKLPGMLKTLGQWLRKLRNLTNDVRSQTGIDDLLRSEGLHGGLSELRGLLRGNHGVHFDPPPPAPAPVPTAYTPPPTPDDAYEHFDVDTSREYPQEGADSYGALPDDLINEEPESNAALAPADAAAPVTTDPAPVTTDPAPVTTDPAPVTTDPA
jgi:sec-independent protein translocase protein TatB